MTLSEQDFCAEGFGQRFAFVDLANSQQWDGFGQMIDHLDEPAWVAAFLSHWGWLDDAISPLPLTELIHMRDVLRQIVETIAGKQHPALEDIVTLNTMLAVPQQQQLQAQNDTYQLVFEPLEPGWTWIQAQIAASFGDFLSHYQWRRLKVCPNSGCRWAFYDETNGNVRRWCNDRTCGNREKVRRFRKRKQK